MITRYNYKWVAPSRKSCPEFSEFELVEQLEPLSYQDDNKKIVKEFIKHYVYVEHKRSWKDFIASYSCGSISDQMISHIKKGTPLITAHTLPPGDYTPEALKKGADIKNEMIAKGITLEAIAQAFIDATKKQEKVENNVEEKKGEVKDNA